jgi:hypothetical protein
MMLLLQKKKTSMDEGGDVYLASSSTHADHEPWLVDSCASFHIIPHREWFYELKGMMEVMFSYVMTQHPKS